MKLRGHGSLLAFLVPTALAYTSEECIAILFDRYKAEYPDYGVAVFNHKPHRKDREQTEGWIWFHKMCSPPFGSIYHVYAIPSYRSGDWLRLIDDGGYSNWRYDPHYFEREGKAITMK